MTIQYINTGTSANAGNGDSIRTAFTKVNNNFAELANTVFTPFETTSTISARLAWLDGTNTNSVIANNQGVQVSSTGTGVIDRVWQFLTNGNLVLPVGGDILNSQGETLFPPQLPISVPQAIGDNLSGVSTVPVENSVIVNTYDANTSTLAVNTWTFSNTGTIVFPDGTEQSTAYTGQGGSTIYDQSLNTYDTVQFASLTSTGTLFQGTAYDNVEFPDTTIRVDADVNSYAEMVMKNHNSGTNASADLVIANDIGTDTANFIDLGINSSNYFTNQYSVTNRNDGYLFVNGGDLVIGTQSLDSKLKFHAGGTTTSDAGGFLDQYHWEFNRNVQVIVGTPGPLNFTVWNTLDNSSAQSTYQAINNAGEFLQMGINSNNAGVSYGNVGPSEGFIHLDFTTATLHIGGSGDLKFWSEESTGGYESGTTATLVMSRLDRSSTFGGHVLPAADLTYDLGSTSSQWRSIYVGTGTIYIGGVALGVDNNNYVTVDGNPVITVNTASGALTIQGNTNIVLGAVAVSDTAPEASTTGSQWFNTVEARTYVAYNDQWVDANPTVLAPPDTNPTLESVTFNDASVQTTAWLGTYSYNNLTDKPVAPTFVGGGGASTWLTAD